MSILKRLTRARYNIGFIISESDCDFLYQKTNKISVNWIDWNGYKGGWFADPFILTMDDTTIEVLVEEWNDKMGKGRISKLVIDRVSNKLVKLKPLLENATHFSFPNIWKEDNKIFVYPENYQSGGLYIYEYDEKKDELINAHCLIKEPLLDAQLTKYKGEYYIFAIRQDNGSKQCNILYVYKAAKLMGDYVQIQTIENPLKEERGAGAIFFHKDKLIRPAQSCEVDYGHSIVFYEMDNKDEKFVEIEIGRIYPNIKQRWNRKIHTYNRYGNLIVVDGYEYVHRFISDLYRATIKKILKIKF